MPCRTAPPEIGQPTTGQTGQAEGKPYEQIRVGAGKSRQIMLRFNSEPLAKGMALTATGRYRGGSFGFTLRLPAA